MNIRSSAAKIPLSYFEFIIDLDGTLLCNDRANLDVVAFMQEVQRQSIDFMIMTNSVKPPHNIIKRLQRVGITVPISCILTILVSINSYLRKHALSRAFIVGSEQ